MSYIEEWQLWDAKRWLARQHQRITAARVEEHRARTAPPEVVHRRVNGQTVIAQRLTTHRCSK